MNHIDAIFYINLETRPDRKEHFLSEIQKLTSDMSKVHRFNAISHTSGLIGCVMSHINILEEFKIILNGPHVLYSKMILPFAQPIHPLMNLH